MGEVIGFNDRRRNFVKGIQLTDANQMKERGGIREKAYDYYRSLSPEERSEIQRRQREIRARRARRERRERDANIDRQLRKIKKGNNKGNDKKEVFTGRKKQLMVAILAAFSVGIAITAVTGAKNLYDTNQRLQNEENLEIISQNQDMLQQLGISQDIIDEIQSLQTELNSDEIENISDSDLLDLGDRVEDVQMYTIKSKLANSLGVSEESIEFSIDYSDDIPTASVIVTKEDGTIVRYNSDGILDFNDNISTEISNYIISIGYTQTASSRLANGTIDKDSVISQYKSAIEDTSQIATKEVEIDENGNISLSQISQQEIDSLIQSEDKTQEDDEER